MRNDMNKKSVTYTRVRCSYSQIPNHFAAKTKFSQPVRGHDPQYPSVVVVTTFIRHGYHRYTSIHIIRQKS
jgi:hypothetical protein